MEIAHSLTVKGEKFAELEVVLKRGGWVYLKAGRRGLFWSKQTGLEIE